MAPDEPVRCGVLGRPLSVTYPSSNHVTKWHVRNNCCQSNHVTKWHVRNNCCHLVSRGWPVRATLSQVYHRYLCVQ